MLTWACTCPGVASLLQQHEGRANHNMRPEVEAAWYLSFSVAFHVRVSVWIHVPTNRRRHVRTPARTHTCTRAHTHARVYGLPAHLLAALFATRLRCICSIYDTINDTIIPQPSFVFDTIIENDSRYDYTHTHTGTEKACERSRSRFIVWLKSRRSSKQTRARAPSSSIYATAPILKKTKSLFSGFVEQMC